MYIFLSCMSVKELVACLFLRSGEFLVNNLKITVQQFKLQGLLWISFSRCLVMYDLIVLICLRVVACFFPLLCSVKFLAVRVTLDFFELVCDVQFERVVFKLVICLFLCSGVSVCIVYSLKCSFRQFMLHRLL